MKVFDLREHFPCAPSDCFTFASQLIIACQVSIEPHLFSHTTFCARATISQIASIHMQWMQLTSSAPFMSCAQVRRSNLSMRGGAQTSFYASTNLKSAVPIGQELDLCRLSVDSLNKLSTIELNRCCPDRLRCGMSLWVIALSRQLQR